MLFADSSEIDRVKTFMMKEFKWITVIQEKIESYAITIYKYYTIYYTRSKRMFSIKRGPALDVQGQKTFHTIMAKLLYLAKRARPDILTATSFLCTRDKQPTKNDQKKLLRVIGYLDATKHYEYNIALTKPLGIIV
jgi:hypothetical protein